MTRGGLAALFTLGGAAILLLATNGEGATLIVPNTVIAWRDLANKYAQIYGILDPEEILAVIWNESTGNPNGSNPGDPSWGLMGVEPLIARAYGGFATGDDSWKTDPDKNVKAGAGFLADLKNKYSSDPNWIAAYNEGETQYNRGTPDQNYVDRFYAHLNALKGA